MVLLFHALWLGAFLRMHDARDLIHIGRDFVSRSHESAVIALDPAYHYAADGVGNDGQYNYYIALDPAHARPYVSGDSYRYTRILYPIAARLVALGRPELVPLALVAVNLAAVVGGVLALAGWLQRRGTSPWFGLLYGLLPAVVVCLGFDFAEPLAMSLVLVGVYLLDAGPRPRWLWGAVAFAMAALTRETTTVFTLAYLVAVPTAQSEGGPTALPRVRFGAIALLPIAIWKAVLWAWTGNLGTGPGLEIVPFMGVLVYPLFPPGIIWTQFLTVILPAMLACTAGVAVLRRFGAHAEVIALLANTLLFVVFLQRVSYAGLTSSLRIGMAVVVAALLCLPLALNLSPRWRPLMRVTAVLWLAPLPVMLLRVAGVLPGV